MRFLILAAVAGAIALPTAANAQHWRGGNNEVRREQRECQRELRRADSRREYARELRECRREIAQARREQYRDRHDGRRYDGYRDGGRYWDGYRWRNRYWNEEGAASCGAAPWRRRQVDFDRYCGGTSPFDRP